MFLLYFILLITGRKEAITVKWNGICPWMSFLSFIVRLHVIRIQVIMKILPALPLILHNMLLHATNVRRGKCDRHTQKARGAGLMLGWSWPIVYEAGPISAQHWADASCLLGVRPCDHFYCFCTVFVICDLTQNVFCSVKSVWVWVVWHCTCRLNDSNLSVK